VKWLAGLILFLFLFGCATPQVKPGEGPCVPQEIYFGIDGKAWKHIPGSGFKTRPIYVYNCIGNDEGDALNLEVVYNGQKYYLFGKTYTVIGTFDNLGDIKTHVEQQRSGPRK